MWVKVLKQLYIEKEDTKEKIITTKEDLLFVRDILNLVINDIEYKKMSLKRNY